MTFRDLSGKRVLLLMPAFFGYDHDVIAALRERGAAVDFLPDRPFDSPLMKGVTRMLPRLVAWPAAHQYEKMLREYGAASYHYIIVINGQTLSPAMMRRLRQSFPAARTVLFMWDSLENRPGFVSLLEYFDRALSFDKLDCKRFGMQFRPLFFAPAFECEAAESFAYDISFVGTAHSDRYAFVDRLRRSLPPSARAFWYLFLQGRWVYQLYRLTKPPMRNARIEEFHFVPLPKPQVQSVFARSKSILDIQHPGQRGMTMRSFEALGARKKLVTTNKDVVTYDFYDPANVCVIDRNNPSLPPGFLDTPYRRTSDDIYQRNALGGWLDDLLDLA